MVLLIIHSSFSTRKHPHSQAALGHDEDENQNSEKGVRTPQLSACCFGCWSITTAARVTFLLENPGSTLTGARARTYLQTCNKRWTSVLQWIKESRLISIMFRKLTNFVFCLKSFSFSKVFPTVPIWLKLLLELPACIQISQSNLWQDPSHSSFRTKWLAAAQQPKCTLLPSQHWPGKAFKNVKQKRVQAFPSILSWPPCSWSKERPHSFHPWTCRHSGNIPLCPIIQKLETRGNSLVKLVHVISK